MKNEMGMVVIKKPVDKRSRIRLWVSLPGRSCRVSLYGWIPWLLWLPLRAMIVPIGIATTETRDVRASAVVELVFLLSFLYIMISPGAISGTTMCLRTNVEAATFKARQNKPLPAHVDRDVDPLEYWKAD